MSTIESKLNALVLIGLCAAGYFILTAPRTPVTPPNDAWFRSAVISRPEPVVVKFGADWCGPCRMMEPELDHLAGKLGGQIAVVRVNVDQHRDLASHYGVSSIPRLLLFRNGQVVADRVGFANHQQLETWVAANAPQ